MKLANADQLGSREVREGVTRRVFTGDGATLAWTTLEPGHTPRPHSHEYEQIVYIVSGRVLFSVGDETAEMGPGDVLLVKGWIEHEMWVLEDTEFVAFLAPVRADLHAPSRRARRHRSR